MSVTIPYVCALCQEIMPRGEEGKKPDKGGGCGGGYAPSSPRRRLSACARRRRRFGPRGLGTRSKGRCAGLAPPRAGAARPHLQVGLGARKLPAIAQRSWRYARPRARASAVSPRGFRSLRTGPGSPLPLSQPAVPRPSHRETPESSASRILSRLSRPRLAAPRLAAGRGGGHRCALGQPPAP